MNSQDEHNSEHGRTLGIELKQPAGAARLRRRLISGGLSAAPVLMAMSSRSALAVSTCLSPSRTMSGNMSHTGQSVNCAAGLSLTAWSQTTNWVSEVKPTLQICTVGRTQNANNCNGQQASQWGAFTLGATPPSFGDFSFVGWTCSSGASTVTVSGGPVAGTTKRVATLGFGVTLTALLGSDGGIPPIVPSYTSDTIAPAVTLRGVSAWEVIAYHANLKAKPGVNALRVELARYCIVAYYNAVANPSTYPVTAAQVKAMWSDGTSGFGYCALSSCTTPWFEQDIINYLISIGV